MANLLQKIILKSPHTLFNKYLEKFEQNRTVKIIQNFVLYDEQTNNQTNKKDEKSGKQFVTKY